MGNFISCTLSRPTWNQSRPAKVVLPSGEVKSFPCPPKAAELMLETPNYFLVNSRSLHMGRRFSPLNADEDLEMGNVYLMFPMRRVNSVITAADMGSLFLTARSAAKRIRVSPENNAEMAVQTAAAAAAASKVDPDVEEKRESERHKLSLDDVEGFSTTEYMHRLSASRSKKPLLETIAEEPVRLSRG